MKKSTAAFCDIVWIQTAFIGDIILTTGASRLAASAFPGAKQFIVTTAAGAAILENAPEFSGRFVLPKRGGSAFIGALQAFETVRRQLKASGVSKNAILLQPHRSARSSLLALYLRLTMGWHVITYRETSLSWLAQTRVPRLGVIHEIHRIALLLEGLGVDRVEILKARPHLSQGNAGCPAWHEAKAQAPQGTRWIGIAPGSVWATKRWPAQSFGTAVYELSRRDHNFRFVVLGSKEDLPLAEQVITSAVTSGIDARRLINLSGATTLTAMARIVSELNLLISNDSMPTHLASAFDIPNVVVFGSTVPAMGFGPLAKRSAVVQMNDLQCRPCGPHGYKACPLGHFDCMKRLDSEAVTRHAIELLS